MTIKSYGAHFGARSVARNYVHRPAYSPEVFEILLALLPPTCRAVLDAGCGPGKLALGLRARVDRIDAVDPSAEMIVLGRSLPGGDDPRINWIQARLEDAGLSRPYGLITCGASVHWLDADRALSQFAAVLAPGGAFAIVEGDAAVDAPWQAAERAVYSEVIERLQGQRPDFPTSQALLERPLLDHPRYRRLGARITAPNRIRQSLDDYLACQHSRATFSIDHMGSALTAEFDAALRAALMPHVRDGMLDYVVQTRVEWGLPLAA
jgi:SAM-dependent methyltransferase